VWRFRPRLISGTVEVKTSPHVGLDLNVPKTSILPKGITQQSVFEVVQNILNSSPTLATLSGNVSLVSFCLEGFVGIGVPIGT
jgi:hypothetical protein